MMKKRIAANPSIHLLVHHRDFSLVWTAGLISMMGDWALWIVLPIRVYELTGSSLATGGLVASLVGAQLVFGSFAGPAAAPVACRSGPQSFSGPFPAASVARWARRRTMLSASLLQAVVILPLL